MKVINVSFASLILEQSGCRRVSWPACGGGQAAACWLLIIASSPLARLSWQIFSPPAPSWLAVLFVKRQTDEERGSLPSCRAWRRRRRETSRVWSTFECHNFHPSSSHNHFFFNPFYLKLAGWSRVRLVCVCVCVFKAGLGLCQIMFQPLISC